ncbi:nitronate monooxygenase [Micromonospora sp. WMMD812]|uniref:NAD(P)H-dependent flavin oxidoreductase n=1 Tax=Micromonospora sp. WMMD812 TaxID=3015152 RepID=UPI00248AF84F|nr:nitronate monooxygenase [Micromonospora sp. WMMD812]WBB68723.1 nitronate monooxygenase [Micromonospora sp. WMMD812]
MTGEPWLGLLGSATPLVGAPMAGGATTPALVRAVTAAGGFGFVPAGYRTPDAVAADLADLRATGTPCGVNLFVPGPREIDEETFRRYAREIAVEGEPYGLDLAGAPMVHDDDRWADKIDLLTREPVPVVSFTFGLPDPAALAALRRAGSRVLVTVTSVDEARAARDLGVDGLVAQGTEAGGHSGTHTPRRPAPPTSTLPLARDVAAATGLPVLAAGGVAGPADVRDLLAAGAAAVAVGTLLLRTDESGASRTHRDALADPARTGTVLTRAFTGRPARGLRNAFIDRYEPTAPLGYPELHHLTRGLRAAAAAAGHPDRVHLWAGTGYRHATTGPAATVVDRLTTPL